MISRRSRDEHPVAYAPAPVGLLGLMGGAFRLYRANFVALIGPFIAASLLMAAIGLAYFLRDSDVAATFVFFLQIAVFSVIGSLLVALAAVVVSDDIVGRRTTMSEAYRRLLPLRSQLISAALYSTILGILGTVLITSTALVYLFGVLGIARILLGPPILAQVIALEGKGLGEASPRARALLKGHALRLFSYLITVSIGLGIIDLFFGVVTASLVDPLGDVARAVIGSLSSSLFMGLLLPYVACLWLIAYHDLRVRKESFDRATLEAESQTRP